MAVGAKCDRRIFRRVVACSCAWLSIGLSARTLAQSTPPLPTPTTSQAASLISEREQLPIDLAAALRLASAQNPLIEVAQARVREAYARQQQAEVLWLPSLDAGGNPNSLTYVPAFSHHDGSIQTARGVMMQTSKSSLGILGFATMTFDTSDAIFRPLETRQQTNAAQARARGTVNETQLQAALSYFDLLEVYGALAINADILAKVAEMVRRSEAAENAGLSKTRADVNRARTEYFARQQERIHWQGQSAVVSARLARLLLLRPTVDLHPCDPAIVPIQLVEVKDQIDELVATALMYRPELAAYRAEVAAALTRWRQEKCRPLLPKVFLSYYGGTFGGGQPALNNFSGRDDWIAQASWEIKNGSMGTLFQIRERRTEYQRSLAQVTALQAQVSAQVTEAARLARFRREALASAQEAVVQAAEMWRRLEASSFGVAGPKGQYDALEPLLAEQALALARSRYLQKVIDYNKSQFQLYTMMGQPPLDALPQARELPLKEPVLPAAPAKR